MAKLISKTYGEALFELAVEESKTDVFVEEIQGILAALEDNPEFNDLMNHPKILKEEKINVMENVFKGRISDELVGFLALIIKKDRYNDVTAILEYFLQEVKHLKGIGTAYVTTAKSLREEQQKKVEETLLAKTKFKQMEMHYSVDESLIGGMVIRIGDRVVDSSVKHKLDDLTRQLMKVQLA